MVQAERDFGIRTSAEPDPLPHPKILAMRNQLRSSRRTGVPGVLAEGRFKCQRLLDESAVLARSVYVELNRSRAGIAETPETSSFTSAHERIQARAKTAMGVCEKCGYLRRDDWLCAVAEGLKMV